ncbi:hypothetical protein [Sphingobium sp. ZW T5_29]|uniref:hypothetical protein n=1 Tax=Sphingobium sp. ZW T5_29 TaxID=3378077 RepID=UPI0038539323
MNATGKQLTTFDAVLTCISAAGYDPDVAHAAAEADIAAGVPPLTAYSRALNNYVSTLPADLQGTIGKIARLVSNSDEATLAQYDAAMTNYNETGDETAIEALYPTMARDGVALALKDGEITQAEIDNGTGIAAALGYDPMPEQIAALQSPAPGVTPAPQEAPQQFRPPAAPEAPQPVPSGQNGIVRDQQGISYSSRRIAAPAAPAATAGIARDQTGISYSSARHGAKSDQWAGRAGRSTSFQPIAHQSVAPGHGPTLEKAGAQFTG